MKDASKDVLAVFPARQIAAHVGLTIRIFQIAFAKPQMVIMKVIGQLME